jgi:hypothetical protein
MTLIVIAYCLAVAALAPVLGKDTRTPEIAGRR